MKERPILFSSPMVNAIRAGRKTQTRRVVKRVKIHADHGEPRWDDAWIDDSYNPPCLKVRYGDENDPTTPAGGTVQRHYCPYGVPGDRLWVKETWWQAHSYPITMPNGEPSEQNGSRLVHYAAEGDPPNTPNRHYPDGLRGGSFAAPDPYASWHKRPSIHMPRWASRILLEVVSVRVERVEAISEADAIAEGFAESFDSAGGCHERTTARENFLAYFWELNDRRVAIDPPWVWAVEFKVIGGAA